MKILLFSILSCTAVAIQAQTLPQSSEKTFADKFSLETPKELKINNLPNFGSINQKKLAGLSSVNNSQRGYKMPILDVKSNNSTIRVYKPDSSFRSNMPIVRNHR